MERTPAQAQARLDLINCAQFVGVHRPRRRGRGRRAVVAGFLLTAVIVTVAAEAWRSLAALLALEGAVASYAAVVAARSGARRGWLLPPWFLPPGYRSIVAAQVLFFFAYHLIRAPGSRSLWASAAVLAGVFVGAVLLLVWSERDAERRYQEWLAGLRLPPTPPRVDAPRLAIAATLAPWARVRLDRLGRDAGMDDGEVGRHLDALVASGHARRRGGRRRSAGPPWFGLTRLGRDALQREVESLERSLGRLPGRPQRAIRGLRWPGGRRA